MRPVLLALILTTLALYGCAFPERRPVQFEPPAPTLVALSAVIANPERFDGRYIATEGVVATGYYDWHIYFSREDYDAYRTLNGAALSVYEGGEPYEERALRRLEGRSVYLSGVFYDGVSGHMGSQRGLIVVQEITEAPARHQLNYLYGYSPAPWLLPWLYIMAGLTALTAAAAVMSRFRPGGRTLTIALSTLVVGMTAFTAVELWGAAGLLRELQIFSSRWGPIAAFTAIFGVIGLVLMWAFQLRRRVVWVLLMVGLQLAVPITRESLRIETWPSQLRYPFWVAVSERAWERAVWPSGHVPVLADRESQSEEPLPRPVFSPPETSVDASSETPNL